MPHFTRHAYERFRTRREELARIQGAIRPHFNRHDYIYRADGTGPGVWIARLSLRDELVLTYLAPRALTWRLRCVALAQRHRPRLVAQQHLAVTANRQCLRVIGIRRLYPSDQV
jgi:hypothetical protein